jgi:hypothetical protein
MVVGSRNRCSSCGKTVLYTISGGKCPGCEMQEVMLKMAREQALTCIKCDRKMPLGTRGTWCPACLDVVRELPGKEAQALIRKTCKSCQEDSVMPAGQDYCPSCQVRIERPAREIHPGEPGLVTFGPIPPNSGPGAEIPVEPVTRLPTFPPGHLYRVTFRIKGSRGKGGKEEVRVTECVVPHEGDVVAAVYLIDRSWPGAVITRMEAVGPVEADLFRPEVAPPRTTDERLKVVYTSDGEPVQPVEEEEKEVTRHTHPSEVPPEVGGYALPDDPARHDFDDKATCRKCGESWGDWASPCHPSRQEQAFQAGNKQAAPAVSHVIGKLLGPGCHQWMPDSSGNLSLFRCDRCGDVRHVTDCKYPDCPGGLLSWEYRHQWPQGEGKGMPCCGMPCCLRCGLQLPDAKGSPVCPGKPVTA